MIENKTETIYRLPDRGMVAVPDYLKDLLPEEHDHFTFYTHEGHSGSVVGRRGIDIDPEGNIYHRIYDYVAEEDFFVPSGYSVRDLEAVEDLDPTSPAIAHGDSALEHVDTDLPF